MVKYRTLLIASFAWFVFLFNIERIDIFGQEPFNLDSSVYVFAMVTLLSIMAFPDLGSIRFSVGGFFLIAFYLFIGLFFRPFFIDQPILIHLVEVLALLVTLFLSQRVSLALLDFEIRIEAFVLDVAGTGMVNASEGEELVNNELYLARRFDRSLSLVYCQVPDMPGLEKDSTIELDWMRWQITKSFKRRFWQIHLAKAIANLTYRGDIIIEYEEGVVVCLPETKGEEADMFIKQLRALMKARFGLDIRVGTASFPDQGLVFDELVMVAKNDQHIIEDDNDSSDDGDAILIDDHIRAGDVWVSQEDRLKISKAAPWMDKHAYQSHSAKAIYMPIKRFTDIFLTVIALPLIFPIMSLVAILIILDDFGNPFYVQERTGYGGKTFKMMKFRSMYKNAKPLPATKMVAADGTVRYLWPEKTDKDERITRVGRFIRKASIDELPQLLNVLKGDMSLVGPRPSSWQLDKYTLHQTERLTVRPGITGLWQVAARESKNFDERLLWDMQYIHKLSFWLDFQILLLTVSQVFNKGGV